MSQSKKRKLADRPDLRGSRASARQPGEVVVLVERALPLSSVRGGDEKVVGVHEAEGDALAQAARQGRLARRAMAVDGDHGHGAGLGLPARQGARNADQAGGERHRITRGRQGDAAGG